MNDNKMVIGIDIAKRVFQLHWVNTDTGEIVRDFWNILPTWHPASLVWERMAARTIGPKSSPRWGTVQADVS